MTEGAVIAPPQRRAIAFLLCHCAPALSLRGTKQSIGANTGTWIATALRASQ
jgi:hypothetical protein